MAAPEPKPDPQLFYTSGLATPYIYNAPYSAYSSYGYAPYAAGYYNNYATYNLPYAYNRGYYY